MQTAVADVVTNAAYLIFVYLFVCVLILAKYHLVIFLGEMSLLHLPVNVTYRESQ